MSSSSYGNLVHLITLWCFFWISARKPGNRTLIQIGQSYFLFSFLSHLLSPFTAALFRLSGNKLAPIYRHQIDLPIIRGTQFILPKIWNCLCFSIFPEGQFSVWCPDGKGKRWKMKSITCTFHCGIFLRCTTVPLLEVYISESLKWRTGL